MARAGAHSFHQLGLELARRISCARASPQQPLGPPIPAPAGLELRIPLPRRRLRRRLVVRLLAHAADLRGRGAGGAGQGGGVQSSLVARKQRMSRRPVCAVRSGAAKQRGHASARTLPEASADLGRV